MLVVDIPSGYIMLQVNYDDNDVHCMMLYDDDDEIMKPLMSLVKVFLSTWVCKSGLFNNSFDSF